MAASIEDKVIEELRVLPEDQQAEVLKYVEDLAGLETKADIRHPAGRFAIWDKIEEIVRDVSRRGFGKYSDPRGPSAQLNRELSLHDEQHA